jgi:hypothetical protein
MRFTMLDFFTHDELDKMIVALKPGTGLIISQLYQKVYFANITNIGVIIKINGIAADRLRNRQRGKG